MSRDDELKVIIANALAEYKAYQLPDICPRYGIFPDESLDPMNSKRIYVQSGLDKCNSDEIGKIAKKVMERLNDKDLTKQMEPFFGDSMLKFSFITRRKLAEFLDGMSNMEGKMKLSEFLSPIWDMEKTYVIFGKTVGEIIEEEVKKEKKKTYKELLIEDLHIKYISDEDFKQFLERLTNPEVREGVDQKRYVESINKIIKNDGYELQVDEIISDLPKYKVIQISKVKSELKNLIFASIGKKPDIVIDDSIANDLKILGDMDDCLLYNFVYRADGLRWNELVEWWKKERLLSDDKAEKNLYVRLHKSLDSDIEKVFFKEYFNKYKGRSERNFPALLPQVYLHYDPYSKSYRKNKIEYTHQRMDFLLLLPNGVRVVIELDGKQHYAEGDVASPKLYAKMVQDDRKLQLKGYEVYRFGGYEFHNNENIGQDISSFFDRLYEKYEIELIN